jgi:hypothetical protein
VVSRSALLLLACLLLSCAKKPEGQRAFHYWRTTFTLSAAERRALTQQHVSKLYLRLFDVSWNQKTTATEPVGLLTFPERLPEGLEVVPVVYVRNSVFAQVAPAALADQVLALVRSQSEAGHFTFHELQLDCDWTESTRAAFFAFCMQLTARTKSEGVTLSATIRLHQVKYSERTGVPPVQRGMLMFYNMGRLAADATRPSIFNPEDAEKYVEKLDAYPLPLDAALPVFSWGVQSRDGLMVELLSKPDRAELEANPSLRKDGPLRFVATSPTLVAGGYLREGDALNLEVMTPASSREAAELLSKHFHPRRPFTISLFDLDEKNLNAFAPQDVDAVFSAVR